MGYNFEENFKYAQTLTSKLRFFFHSQYFEMLSVFGSWNCYIDPTLQCNRHDRVNRCSERSFGLTASEQREVCNRCLWQCCSFPVGKNISRHHFLSLWPKLQVLMLVLSIGLPFIKISPTFLGNTYTYCTPYYMFRQSTAIIREENLKLILFKVNMVHPVVLYQYIIIQVRQ